MSAVARISLETGAARSSSPPTEPLFSSAIRTNIRKWQEEDHRNPKRLQRPAAVFSCRGTRSRPATSSANQATTRCRRQALSAGYFRGNLKMLFFEAWLSRLSIETEKHRKLICLHDPAVVPPHPIGEPYYGARRPRRRGCHAGRASGRPIRPSMHSLLQFRPDWRTI